ncbi:MAG TPA: CcdC protein domain-containing protein [Sphingomonas sp.]|nr:CcdC protein domain-containing protein [Sphingomonas sp.]
MQDYQAQPGGWLQALIIAAIVLVVAMRMRGTGRLRPLRLERLWVIPALYLALVILLFVQAPPPGLGAWISAVFALGAGAFLGWQLGRLMRIHVDPETHALSQQSSAAGMIFIVVLIAVRYAARDLGGEMHMNMAIMTDTLAALALGMFSAQRVEMYLRARRMLDAARAG